MLIKFSVVVPAWNAATTIKATLQCVFSQIYRADEVVVVNDGSTDGTQAILDELSSEFNITVLRIENSGPSTARNAGAAIVKNDYVAFLDADDYWHPHHLENLSKLIQKAPTHSLFVSGYATVTGIPRQELICGRGGSAPSITSYNLDSYLLARLCGRRIAWTSAVAVRKNDFYAAGCFDRRFKHGEDQGLWLRLTAIGGAAKSDYVTALYVKSKHGLSSKIVTDVDGCMYACTALINSGVFSRKTNFLLNEFYNKYALTHAANALRLSDHGTARNFLAMAKTTRLFAPKRLVLLFLTTLIDFVGKRFYLRF